MQTTPRITLRKVAPSEALEQRIFEETEKLEQFCDQLVACRVVVDKPHHHKHKGTPFEVSVDVTMPGREFVVSHRHDEDVYVALHAAFQAARRQIRDYIAHKSP